jgi:hypothetical protein
MKNRLPQRDAIRWVALVAGQGGPGLRRIIADDGVRRGLVQMRFSQGLQAFSFTFG